MTAEPLPPTTLCNARTRSGGTCSRVAGFGTDHLGQGRCKYHGGATPIRSGRYSTITRPRIAELVAQFEDDPDPLNMLPELAAARALFVDFVERYDVNTAALLAWHAARNAENGEPEPDPDVEPPSRPRGVISLHDARELLAEITRIVKRIEDIRAANAISRYDFFRVMSEMGRIVDLCVEDDATRTRIHDLWGGIRLA